MSLTFQLLLSQIKNSGPSCSKLMMSLVNISLKLWSLNMAYTLIFLLKKCSSFCICKSYSHFFSKNTCELDIVLTRTVNILTTNELVKLMMLWTTGPWSLIVEIMRVNGTCSQISSESWFFQVSNISSQMSLVCVNLSRFYLNTLVYRYN